jgi:pheromone shutdown-related protein TraB
MQYRNLYIIGTSHIAAQSVNEVTAAIEDFKPDIIALELDQKRMFALLSGKRARKERLSFSLIRKVGLQGFLFLVIASFVQKRLGRFVNMDPGSEMRAAIVLAQKKNIPVALIDQDIETTLARLSEAITWKEKFNMVAEFFKGLFFPRRQLQRYGLEAIDLTKVPDKAAIKKLIGYFKEIYPNIYRVLVSERNEHMAERLKYMMECDFEKRILAVVGAGHEEDMIELIRSIGPNITYSFSPSA